MERMKAIASLATTPVIVVTARDPATSRERALTAGAHAFLQKPIDMSELSSAIASVLGD